jgi:hypothetical protein
MEETLRTILSYTLEAAAPILAALLAALLIKALRWAGVKVDAARSLQIDHVANKAVAYAEQIARRKAKLGEPSMDGKAKMEEALKFGLEALGDKLPADFAARVEVQLSHQNQWGAR